MKPILKIALPIAALFLAGAAMAQPANPLPQETLLGYLDQLTEWQRSAVGVDPSGSNPREAVFRDSLHDNAGRVLQSGFEFLRTVSDASPDNADQVDPESTRGKLNARAAEIRDHIAELKKHGSSDELRIEEARMELVNTILANMNSAASKSPNKLRYTIDSLTRSIPELNGIAAKAADKKLVDKKDETDADHSAPSILSISATIFEATRKQRELSALIDATTQLKNQSMALMKKLRAGLGDPAAQPQDEDDDAPKAAPMSADERVAAYHRIGAFIIPLADTMRWIDSSKQTATEWRNTLEAERKQLFRQLAIYVGILCGALILAAAVSELARRAIKRVPDPKKKRKLNTARRILTGLAVLFILLFNFISDFGSFATFAGFMTAGLAVALQSVLLSLVAHFLFYGRYGVRVGDRVNVAGVTGEIAQVGWVRFYLLELDEETMKPTGRTVAFSNAILFQNLAFYKYSA